MDQKLKKTSQINQTIRPVKTKNEDWTLLARVSLHTFFRSRFQTFDTWKKLKKSLKKKLPSRLVNGELGSNLDRNERAETCVLMEFYKVTTSI